MDTVTVTPPLSDLPEEATVREVALWLTFEQAMTALDSIRAQMTAGTLRRPYPLAVRHTLRIVAEVVKKEALP